MITTLIKFDDAQLKAFYDLFHLVCQQDGGGPLAQHHLLQANREPPSHFLYYDPQHPTTLLACLSVYFFEVDGCEITLLVHPQYRRQGIATALLHAAAPLYQQSAINHLTFTASTSVDLAWMFARGCVKNREEYQLSRLLTPVKRLSTPSRLTITCAAQEDELIALSDLDKACFARHDPAIANYYRTLLPDPTYRLLIARYANQIIGKVHLRREMGGLFLSDLAVFPEYQGQGFGGELLRYAINYGIEQGEPILRLNVECLKKEALHLYLQNGFEIQHQIIFLTYPLTPSTFP